MSVAPTHQTTPQMETNTRRSDNLKWHEYFMAVAMLTSQRSQDPKTQVGACIRNVRFQLVGMGYNGFPSGCSDEQFSWEPADPLKPLDNKYLYVCLAVSNAIMHKTTDDLRGCTLYTTHLPTLECVKLIIQSGISHVYYLQCRPNENVVESKARDALLKSAKVEMEKFMPINTPFPPVLQNPLVTACQCKYCIK